MTDLALSEVGPTPWWQQAGGGAMGDGTRSDALFGSGSPGHSAQDGRADLAFVVLEHHGALCSRLARDLAENPDFGPALRDGGRAESDEIARFVCDALRGDWDAYALRLVELVERWASLGVGFEGWCCVPRAIQEFLVEHLVQTYGDHRERLAQGLGALHRFVERFVSVVARACASLELAHREPLKGQSLRTPGSSVSPQSTEVGFARLYESGLVGILICDLVGNIKEANDAFLGMVGYSRDELLSGVVRWSEMTPIEWRSLDDDAVEQLKRTGVTRTWEKEYFRKDGTRVPILVGVAMLSDSECIAFILDITERRRFEELRAKSLELESQNRRIQEANRLKSEFLANMSHELRTPLNSIIGFAELLHDGEVAADSPQSHEFLGDILASGRHLLQLINDVLDLAKVEAGKIDFRPERVDVSHLISEVTAILRGVSAAKAIRIETHVDATIAEVTVDPSRLKQVLYNYLSNALKFTADGGRVEIRVTSVERDAFRLDVEDTGIGIAAEDLSRLFVEFQQLNAGLAKRHAGTGLGLALSKRIVEAQGGSVGVRSEPGRGSVFFAILPRHTQAERPSSPTLVLPDPLPDAPSVLVVEDDPRDLTLIMRTLSSAGFGPESATTGAHAVARCADRRFDAITLDLLLPDMTGLDVLHRIRTEGKNRATPVLVLSVVAERGVVGGFAVHDYLCKPVNGRDIVAALEGAGVRPERNRSVLVVDDDPSSRKLMDVALTKLGYRTLCRADGANALDALDGEALEAIVLDLLMPGVDGFEFLRRLRQNPTHARVPVVVWTMKDLTEDDRHQLHASAQAVLRKGVTDDASLVDDLRRILRSLVVPKAGALATEEAR